MPIYTCPKGHTSAESDYCSECGAKINGIISQTLTTVPQVAPTLVTCPDCSAPHDPDGGHFCEICGYNFVTGAHGEVPPVEVAPATQTNAPEISKESSDRSIANLEIIITVDPSLRTAGSPEPPTDRAPIIIRLDKQSNLIGRHSEIRAIYPEIPLDFDDAVSHRHAVINRQPDGTFILRDIGSTNGTHFQGVELQPMVDIPLKDGDEFTLGHWTRIKVKLVSCH